MDGHEKCEERDASSESWHGLLFVADRPESAGDAKRVGDRLRCSSKTPPVGGDKIPPAGGCGRGNFVIGWVHETRMAERLQAIVRLVRRIR